MDSSRASAGRDLKDSGARRLWTLRANLPGLEDVGREGEDTGGKDANGARGNAELLSARGGRGSRRGAVGAGSAVASSGAVASRGGVTSSGAVGALGEEVAAALGGRGVANGAVEEVGGDGRGVIEDATLLEQVSEKSASYSPGNTLGAELARLEGSVDGAHGRLVAREERGDKVEGDVGLALLLDSGEGLGDTVVVAVLLAGGLADDSVVVEGHADEREHRVGVLHVRAAALLELLLAVVNGLLGAGLLGAHVDEPVVDGRDNRRVAAARDERDELHDIETVAEVAGEQRHELSLARAADGLALNTGTWQIKRTR